MKKSVFSCHCFKIFEIFPCLTFSEQDPNQGPGLHRSLKDRKHMFANRFLNFHLCLSLHIFVMIAGIHISQEIFAIDMLTALKSSLIMTRSQECFAIVRTICRSCLIEIKLRIKTSPVFPLFFSAYSYRCLKNLTGLH